MIEISRSLLLTSGNSEQYATASGLELNDGTDNAFRLYLDGGTTGYAILNTAAKEVLYPSATAHPFKLDSTIKGSRSAGSMLVNLQIDSADVHTAEFTSAFSQTRTSTDMVSPAITGSNRSSTIRWQVKSNSQYNAARVHTAEIKLYFYQHDFAANKVGNGVNSVSVSNSAPYTGDSVTFSANIKSGATWHGWYSDAACTNLVSTQQSYTVTAGADTYLFAYATANGTGLYLKRNGTFIEAQGIYRKVNGAWEPADKTAFSTETKYKLLN